MPRLPSKPLLVPVTFVALSLVLAEGWGWQRWRRAAVQELKSWERLRQERDWLAHQVPALTAENQAALAENVAAADRVRGEMERMLEAGEPAGKSAPAGPTDAFFDLADFVGRLRARASQAQVMLKSGECFGFASYSRTSPPAGLVATLHRQRLATEYLVELLLEAQPHSLLAVRRERGVGESPADGSSRADDAFELDRRLSVRRPGQVEGEACELEFSGDTAVLRRFLNALAAGPRPVLVRSVQVETLAGPATALSTTATHRAADLSPLAVSSRSRFSVTVEMVRLGENPVPATP